VLYPNPFPRQTIDVGCTRRLESVTTKAVGAKGVDRDEDDVRLRRRCFGLSFLLLATQNEPQR
jgi:hypothetical protein